jgi:pimeloyl-ACP methyl ester carboxylesterase
LNSVVTLSGRPMKLRTMGSGSPLLCLNGLTQTTANWTSSARLLADFGHQVLLTDLPGQGGSEPLPDGNPKAQAELVFEFLDVLGIDKIDVCGFSFGGRVALQMAALRPDRIPRLILTSTSLGAGTVARLVVMGWLRALDRGGLEALGWDALPWIIGDGLLNGIDPEQMVHATVRRNSAAGIRSLIQGILDDKAPALESIAMPTLVLAGGDDRFALADEQRANAERLPQGRFHRFAGLGHALPVEDAKGFSEVVSAFLRA